MKGRLGSLFAGIGGFELALEEWYEPEWQVENNRQCNQLLSAKWPNRRRYGDVRWCWVDLTPIDLLAAGDPCQCRSVALRRAPKGSRKAPDLSGYVLAIADRLRPRWVLRENVLSPDVVHVVAGLDTLRYRTCVVHLDGADFTACHRRRQFVVASLDHSVHRRFERLVAQHEDVRRHGPAGPKDRSLVLPCLLASDGGKQFSSDSGYVWEQERGILRKLAPEERERALGFPAGWTAGFAPTRRGSMLGNSVNVPCVRWIGNRINQAEANRR